MSAYTFRLAAAAEWIAAHPELREPAVHAFPHPGGAITVELAWHLTHRYDLDQTETAKQILDTVGGEWKAENNTVGTVLLRGPIDPFRFLVYVTAPTPEPHPVPADLGALGVTR